jgi:hypothetical protein
MIGDAFDDMPQAIQIDTLACIDLALAVQR